MSAGNTSAGAVSIPSLLRDRLGGPTVVTSDHGDLQTRPVQVRALADGPSCGAGLAAPVGSQPSNVYATLAELRAAGLVEDAGREPGGYGRRRTDSDRGDWRVSQCAGHGQPGTRHRALMRLPGRSQPQPSCSWSMWSQSPTGT
ncbi:hypothetical protein GCM10010464_12780 [Pseudonocardia yunnanensis]